MDFYEILQVDRRADPEVIQAAYRALARRHHPDMGGDPVRMVAINEAWDVLGDPTRRRGYDVRLGRSAALATASGRAPTSTPVQEPPRYQPRRTDPASASVAGDRVLDFGRYAGCTISDVSRQDPDYLLWLERTMVGRSLRSDIQRALSMRPGPAMAMAVAGPPVRSRRGRWFR